MKCLVTGGAGFIGSNLVDELIRDGHTVTIVDNFSTGKEENLKKFGGTLLNINAEDVKIDKPHDVIFHLAALARIQPSIELPLESHAANLTSTVNMLNHAKKWGAKFIFSSSSSVYGAGKEPPFNEDMIPNPGSPYALQKFTSEQYCHLYHELFGLETVSLRYFNVFGERQPTTGAYAVAMGIFMRQMKEGKPITIFGGEQRRDFTYVKDVVRANIDAMNVPHGVYNVGTGVNYSINEIVDLISKTHPREYSDYKPGEYPVTLADMTKFEKVFGWKPQSIVPSWIKKQV